MARRRARHLRSRDCSAHPLLGLGDLALRVTHQGDGQRNARTNDLTEENLLRIARQQAARLAVKPGSRGHDEGRWRFEYRVTNWGDGTAYDASLSFVEGQAALGEAVHSRDTKGVNLWLTDEALGENVSSPGYPKIQAAYFRDGAGDWWEQEADSTGELRPARPLIEG